MTYKPSGPRVVFEETTPLANGAEFTSAWYPRVYESMIVAIKSDVDLDYFLEFSTNETDVDASLSYTYIDGAINVPRRLIIAREFFRVRVQNNSGGAQSVFRLETSEGNFPKLESRLNSTIDTDADALVVRAIGAGIDPNGDYVNTPVGGQVDAASTSVPLGIGGVWVSDLIDLSGYTAVSSSLSSDVNGTLSATWYADAAGTIAVRSFVAPYTAATTPDVFNGTGKITNYIRLTYTNGSVAQSVFSFLFFASNSLNPQHLSLNSFLPSNSISQLTRSVTTGIDDNGVYQNIGVENVFEDQYGLQTASLIRDKDGSYLGISNFSEAKVTQRRIETEAKFYYNINTINLTTETVATGAASVSNRQAVLTTGTNAAGSAKIETKRTPSYIVSQDIACSNTFVFSSVTGTVGSQVGPANCTMKVGLINSNDEISFGFDGATTFNIFITRSGVTTKINQANFNVDKLDADSPYTPDWTKLQLIRFNYSWHGVTPFVFQIEDTSGTWKTFHIQSFVNVSSLSSIGTPSLPLTAMITNTGSTANNSMVWQAGQISVIGTASESAAERNFIASRARSLVGGATTVLLSVRSKTTYASLANFINSSLGFISLATNGNKSVVFSIIRNGTLTGDAFADIDTTNSVVELDTTATAITGGKLEGYFPLASTDSYISDIANLRININPGDTLTLVGLSASSNDVNVALRWSEIH